MPSPLALVLCDARLDELPHQRCREGLVDGKADGALGCLVRRELLLERVQGGPREEAAVMLERREAHQRAVVRERREPVADDLSRVGRVSLDLLAQPLKSGTRSGRDPPDLGGYRGSLLQSRARS